MQTHAMVERRALAALCGLVVMALLRAPTAWAQDDHGSIVAWGDNSWGQCNVPAPNSGFVGVAGGWMHTLGLKADRWIVGWGSNEFGQCNVPAPNSGFVAIAAGYVHSLGLKAGGSRPRLTTAAPPGLHPRPVRAASRTARAWIPASRLA